MKDEEHINETIFTRKWEKGSSSKGRGRTSLLKIRKAARFKAQQEPQRLARVQHSIQRQRLHPEDLIGHTNPILNLDS